MNQSFKLATILLVMVMTCGIALAQFAKPEDAITYRKAVMQVIGHHFGNMASVVKGEQTYERAAFETNAQIVAMMAKLPWEASLVPGSYSEGTTLKEKALKDSTGYRAAAKKFEEASQNLFAAAKSSDLKPIKSKFGATAKTCSSCHKAYRK